jgi:UPF0755 protein
MKKKFLITILLIFGMGGVSVALWLFIYAQTPITPDKGETVTIDIPTGTGFFEVTDLLSRAGLVKNKPLFYTLAALKRAARSIRAGEYEFSTAQTPLQMLDKLIRGEIKYYRVTIPEDLSMKEIAEKLKEFKLIDEDAFFDLAYDKAFLSSLGIKASSVEGYLFPDTYFLTRSMSTRQIMRIMVDRFFQKVSKPMFDAAAQKGLTPHQYVTFASLVGKETGYRAEKPTIAAVFFNRLRIGMPLQSDPTAVYDLKDFDGVVLRSHYRRISPYNTYIIKGLPPGPIANPGLDSFQAVLKPADVDYLYFVAQKDGTHFFSSTLDQHYEAFLRVRKLKRNSQKSLN